ncbi:hypothetical protein OEZ86_010569 [Tetradesmus obliquus]|nr:hypothetical protein OEZ86_010569 [Tetradesmus obliquus]
MASEAFRVVVVLLGLVAGAVAASGPRATERRLLQQTLCPEGCESQSVSPGSCVYDGTSGFVLCVNCKTSENLVAAPDGSCGCSPGSYLSNSPPKCQPCELGNFCLGGSATASTQTSCGPNLTTRNKGASRRDECVAEAGYRLTTSGAAEQCPVDTFNSGKNKLTSCTPCPAGLTTNQGLGKNSGNDCLVRPGWRAGSGSGVKAVRCPRGQYRGGFAAYSAAASCTACPQQTTTQFSASSIISNCTMLLPGRSWIDPTKQVLGPNPPTQECPLHSWCAGGIFETASDGSEACLNGLWTNGTGATSVRSCRVPPGHYLNTQGTVEACLAGSYQQNWLDPAATAAKSCVTCGVGVQSTTCTFLSGPAASVAGSSSCCYIRMGEGVVVDSSASSTSGRLTFRAVTCTGNHYGVNVTRSILTSSPCRACPLGTVTSTSTLSVQPCSGDQCRDGVTGGFYNKAACRYPTGATCGSIQGSSNSGRTFSSCSALRPHYDTSKATATIEGMTQTEASGQCCTELTCTGYSCPTPTQPKTPVQTGQAPSTDYCCVYKTGATCADTTGTGQTGSAYACQTPTPTLWDSAQTLSIVGKTEAAASSTCCFSGVYKTGATCADTTGTGQTGSAYACQTPTPTLWDSAQTLSIVGKTEAAASSTCCFSGVYKTGATCADTTGTGQTGSAYACQTPTPTLWDSAQTLSIVGKTEAAASSTCCFSGVYKTGATCADTTGTGQTGSAYACQTPTPTLWDSAQTLSIVGKTEAAASSTCCFSGVYKTGATCADTTGTGQTGSAYACQTPTPTLWDSAQTLSIVGKTEAAASSTCCFSGVYKTGATCADTTGTGQTGSAYACQTPTPTLWDSAQTLSIVGKTEAAASSTCCFSGTYPGSATCNDVNGNTADGNQAFVCLSSAYTRNSAVGDIQGLTKSQANAVCCDPVYKTGATCADTTGTGQTGSAYACQTPTPTLWDSAQTLSIVGKTEAAASSTCCFSGTYLGSATCNDVNGNTADGNQAFVCLSSAYTRNSAVGDIQGLTKSQANAVCCDPVYRTGATVCSVCA